MHTTDQRQTLGDLLSEAAGDELIDAVVIDGETVEFDPGAAPFNQPVDDDGFIWEDDTPPLYVFTVSAVITWIAFEGQLELYRVPRTVEAAVHADAHATRA